MDCGAGSSWCPCWVVALGGPYDRGFVGLAVAAQIAARSPMPLPFSYAATVMSAVWLSRASTALRQRLRNSARGTAVLS